MVELVAHVALYEGFSDLPGSQQRHWTIGIALPGIPRAGETVDIGELDHRVKYVWYVANEPQARIEFERMYSGHDGWQDTIDSMLQKGWR